VIPKARRQGLGLLVTPDTIVRWHRDIVRRRWAAGSVRGKTGRPATRLRRILSDYEAHHNQHRPHRSLHSAAPLKPLPEPIDLARYRVPKHARTGSLINEYRLVARHG
jgi:putative transposase